MNNIESVIDVSAFDADDSVLEGSNWLFVIKSQNQIERRRKMLETRKGKKFGRLDSRPTEVGVLVKGKLKGHKVENETVVEFMEPRHIIPYKDGRFFLTDVSSVKEIDMKGNVYKTYKNELFTCLHTVDIDQAKRKLLVSASGYDSIVEFNIDNGMETYRWVAWYNGFNPDEDGNWLAFDDGVYDDYLARGKKVKKIDPAMFCEQGITTAHRSAHPNAAVYNPYTNEASFVVSLGHEGDLYEVDFNGGKPVKVIDFLSIMPHGIKPHANGWCVTNTTQGEWFVLNENYSPIKKYSIKSLGGKVDGTEDVEWLQQVIPLEGGYALLLDANRGLIAMDLKSKKYSVYQPDPNWCFQDAHCLDGESL